MIYLIGLMVVIALSVWLWGEHAVKKTIKIILGLLVIGIIFLIAIKLIEAQQKKDQETSAEKTYSECRDTVQKTYQARPICPSSVISFDAEEKNQCKIDWNSQTNQAEKADWEIQHLFKTSIECARN